MPKPLKATTDGICGRCGKPYYAGSPVTYSRIAGKTNERYHFPQSECYRATGASTATATRLPMIDAIDVVLPTAKTPATVPAIPVRPVPSAPTLKRLRASSPWYDVLPVIMDAGFNRLLLVGPPGTGKSKTASDGYLYRVTCHEDAGPESLIGTFIQKDGETRWIDGPAIRAMREGTRLILDEIDHTSSENMSLLYALLDDSPAYMLPTGENVTAIRGYNVICTSNASPSDLPDAILDRIEGVLCADFPHSAAIDYLRDTAVSGTADAATAIKRADSIVAVLTNYYRHVITRESWNWSGKPTLRRMRNFAKLLSAGVDQTVSAKVVFGESGEEIVSCMTTAKI